MLTIFHITTKDHWQNALVHGEYLAQSLESEGFIHCSTAEQVLQVANSYYAGQPDLVLLKINPQLVPAEVRYEDCYETGQEYPHIYGSVPLSAVVIAVDFPAEPDGTFKMPAGI